MTPIVDFIQEFKSKYFPLTLANSSSTLNITAISGALAYLHMRGSPALFDIGTMTLGRKKVEMVIEQAGLSANPIIYKFYNLSELLWLPHMQKAFESVGLSLNLSAAKDLFDFERNLSRIQVDQQYVLIYFF